MRQVNGLVLQWISLPLLEGTWGKRIGLIRVDGWHGGSSRKALRYIHEGKVDPGESKKRGSGQEEDQIGESRRKNKARFKGEGGEKGGEDLWVRNNPEILLHSTLYSALLLYRNLLRCLIVNGRVDSLTILSSNHIKPRLYRPLIKLPILASRVPECLQRHQSPRRFPPRQQLELRKSLLQYVI